jgi:serine/threonine protein kinase
MHPEDREREENHPSPEDAQFDSKGRPFFTPIEALVGTKLDQYRIVREIGRGSMGVVFEAKDENLSRSVALKILPPNINLSDKVIRRFLREAESVAKLDHPNIVTIYGIGHKESIYYYAMELVEGRPLDEILKEGRFIPFKRIARLIIQACEAVEFAHAHQIIHRDIKPGNIIVTDGDKVVITDFGLARQEKAATLTESGALVGTPIYMSPEQIIARRGGVDARTDIYSMGVTLYQLLTGNPPFKGDSTQEILNKILEEEPPPPHRERFKVPWALSVITLKAMEKEADLRFQSAADMGAELHRYLKGETIRSKPTGWVTKTGKRIRKHKVISALAAITVILALAFGTYFVRASQKMQESHEEQQTQVMEEREKNEKYYANIKLAKDLMSRPNGIGANLATTLSLLNEAEELYPERPEAHLHLGRIFEFQNNARRALEEYTLAIEYGPRNCEAYMSRALLLIEQGRELDQENAIYLGFSDLQQAMELDQDDPEIAYQMALVLYDSYEAKDLSFEERRLLLGAAHNFATIAQDLGTNAEVECLTAQTYLGFAEQATSEVERMTNLESALRCLDNSIEIDPDHSAALVLREEVRRMMEQPKEEQAPQGLVARLGLKDSFTHAEKIYAMMAQDIERIWSETEKTEVLNNLMNVLWSPDPVVSLAQSQLEAAAEDEKEVGYPELLEQAAGYLESGNHGEAVRCYKKARVLNPAKAHELNYNIAEIYYEQNDLGPALQHARLAYSQDAEKLPYLQLLGDILQDLGDSEGFSRLYYEAKKNGYLPFLGWELPAMEGEGSDMPH